MLQIKVEQHLIQVSVHLQVTGYLVFVNVISGAGAIIPAMLILPTTARHEAKQLMHHTTLVRSLTASIT